MTPPPIWVGWYRLDPRYPWRPVVEAATEDEAWDGVLDFPMAGDKLVSRHNPNRDRDGRRPARRRAPSPP